MSRLTYIYLYEDINLISTIPYLLNDTWGWLAELGGATSDREQP